MASIPPNPFNDPDLVRKIEEAIKRKQEQDAKQFHRMYPNIPKGPHHGKHRRPNPQAHSDPIDGASPADDGADAFRPIIRTRLPAASWRLLSGGQPLASQDPDPSVDFLPGIHQRLLSTMIYGNSPALDILPKAPTPYAGILAGEITGHRAWFLYQGKLCSLAHFFLWEPGQTVSGDIDKAVDQAGLCPIMGGIYSFRTYDYVKDVLDLDWPSNQMNWPRMSGFDSSIAAFGSATRYQIDAIVWGTILQWGDVVEHQKGYRSQFAKVASLDGFYGQCDLDSLRQTYGVANGSPR